MQCTSKLSHRVSYGWDHTTVHLYVVQIRIIDPKGVGVNTSPPILSEEHT
jgi:hypothetical protein